MNRQFLLLFLGSFAVIGTVAFLTVQRTHETSLHLEGKVLGNRLVAFTDGATLAMVDFEATNPSELPFEIRSIEIEAVKNGETIPSRAFGKTELKGFLEFQRYTPPNPQMGFGDSIKPGEKARRMVAARFERDMAELKDAEFVVRLRNVNDIRADRKSTRLNSSH